MKIRIVATEVLLFFLLTICAAFVSADATGVYEIENKDITITYNGEKIDCKDQSPVIRDGRTLVPLRTVFEYMGCKVSFNNGKITAVRDDETVQLAIGSENAKIIKNNKSEDHILDVAPIIENERTLIPVRFAAEALGCKINWNPSQKEVVIIDTEEWKESVKEESPIADIFLSTDITDITPKTFQSSGSFTYTYKLDKIKNNKTVSGANIKFSTDFSGKTLSSGGVKQFIYTINLNISGLKTYANSISDKNCKSFLQRASELKRITLNAILDEEYNLYLSGDAFSKLLSVCGQSSSDFAGKALKIPMGTLLTDYSGLPLGTILRTGSVWDGIDKAIAEDNTMFTQRVKILDDILLFIKNAFGGTVTEKANGKTIVYTLNAEKESNKPACNIKLTTDDAKISKLELKLSHNNTVEGESEKVSSAYAINLNSSKLKSSQTQIKIPEKIVEWEDFLASDAGKALISLFEYKMES